MLKENPMLPDTAASKVTAAHLSRRALLYIRQSSLKQVIHNTESAIRQYDLRGKALALGWAADQITVIDIDQGHSGASAADREGFQQLVAEVSLGRAGIVLGLECSRLARNSADWHQLLELCGLTGTLICDEDGLYDPRNFNDRLLLGLKGALSEAELHFIRARLRGGIISKARRGELITPLPVGLAYDPAGHVILDPDTAVQGALKHLFATFEATGSASACVKAFNTDGLNFPWRHRAGPRKGELDWKPLQHHVVLRVLHNPRYAGAFTFGRRREQKLPGGKTTITMLPRGEWIAFIPGAHPGYISLDRYEANLATLAANAAAHGPDRAAGPAREGPALLQGIIICGRCGRRMTLRYHTRHGQQTPTYVCQRDGIAHGHPPCTLIPGHTETELACAPARQQINQLPDDLAPERIAACLDASRRIRLERHLAYPRLVVLECGGGELTLLPIAGTITRLLVPFRLRTGTKTLAGDLVLRDRDPLPLLIGEDVPYEDAITAWTWALLGFADATCVEHEPTKPAAQRESARSRQRPPYTATQYLPSVRTLPRTSRWPRHLEPVGRWTSYSGSRVAAHLRHLPNGQVAREDAQDRARQVGIILRPGETWVKAHIRGVPDNIEMRFRWHAPTELKLFNT
jgi:DNA invertase Pin-like site-specific DNA recombinase